MYGTADMDPNETLRRIRSEVGKILNENDWVNPEVLAELVRDLDQWITRGGSLPYSWNSVFPKG